jgi:hypothetical protein
VTVVKNSVDSQTLAILFGLVHGMRIIISKTSPQPRATESSASSESKANV